MSPKLIACGVLLLASATARSSELITREMETPLLPKPLHFTVLLPDGYAGNKDPLPLLYALHGGDGDNGFLGRMRDQIEAQWKVGTLAQCIVVTPDAGRSFYMDYKDGSQKWETLLTGPFLDHLRKTYRIKAGREGAYFFGISMGGLGGLRMALKYPGKIRGCCGYRAGHRSGAALERHPAKASFLAVAGFDGIDFRKAVGCGVLGS